MLIEYGSEVKHLRISKEGATMKPLLSHQGKRVTITLDESPAAVLGLWQTVQAENPTVAITPRLDNVRIEGPVEHALWACFLWLTLVDRHSQTLGFEVNEGAWERFRAMQTEIREMRGR